jgi:hypothetical protein
VTLVSHRHEFVFLKTRKTGGSSFEMLLEPFCAPSGHEVVHHTKGRVSADGIIGVRAPAAHIPHLRSAGELPVTDVQNRRGETISVEWRSHMPARMVRRGIGMPAWRRYRRVTAVRNPFTRAISLFFFKMKREMIPSVPYTIAELREAFSGFVSSGSFETDYEITHIDNTRIYHEILRLEHREADILRLAARLGINLDPSALPHVKNLRPDREGLPVRDLFDNRSAESVRQRCRWMFDELGYSPDVDAAQF